MHQHRDPPTRADALDDEGRTGADELLTDIQYLHAQNATAANAPSA
jgi:hypothetical protein